MAQSRQSLTLQYFPNPIVSQIHGKPTFPSIYKLHQEIKANAASVPSTLGGGQHGHLGIVLSPMKYQLISLTPFNKPVDPGPPTLTANMTWNQMQAVRLANKEARDEFDKVISVEAALKQQITTALQPEYLQDLKNPITHTIKHPISVIFDTLYNKYGKITKKQSLPEKGFSFQSTSSWL